MPASLSLIDEAIAEAAGSALAVSSGSAVQAFTDRFVDDICDADGTTCAAAAAALNNRFERDARTRKLLDAVAWNVFGTIIARLDRESFQSNVWREYSRLLDNIAVCASPRETQLMALEQLTLHSNTHLLEVAVKACALGISSVSSHKKFKSMRSSLDFVLRKIRKILNGSESEEDESDSEGAKDRAESAVTLFSATVLAFRERTIGQENGKSRVCCLSLLVSFSLWMLSLISPFIKLPIEVIRVILENGEFDWSDLLIYSANEMFECTRQSVDGEVADDEKFNLAMWPVESIALLTYYAIECDEISNEPLVPLVWTQIHRYNLMYPQALVLLKNEAHQSKVRGVKILCKVINQPVVEAELKLKCINGRKPRDPTEVSLRPTLSTVLEVFCAESDLKKRSEGTNCVRKLCSISGSKRRRLNCLIELFDSCPNRNLKGFAVDLIRREVHRAQKSESKNDPFKSKAVSVFAWKLLREIHSNSIAVLRSEMSTEPIQHMYENLDVSLATLSLWTYILLCEGHSRRLSDAMDLWDDRDESIEAVKNFLVDIEAAAQKSIQFWLSGQAGEETPKDTFKVELLSSAARNLNDTIRRVRK